MNKEELIEIIQDGESSSVEFKTSFNKEAMETLVAFASTKGGTLLVGVRDDNTAPGINVGPETLQNWINQCKQNSTPSIIPDVEIVEIDGKKVAVFTIDKFPIRPVAFKNRYFKRVANSNHSLSISEITDMHLQSLPLSWDSYENPDVTLNDIDRVKVDKFIQQVNQGGRFNLEGNWKNALQKLRLIKSDKPTHGAMLLFGNEAPPYNIHLGRFKTPSHILDDKMISTTLFGAVEESMKYILSHLKVAFEFTGEIQRKEIFEYPLPALRELVLNAVVHRDYTSPIDIQIKIFDDAITIFNPGKLLEI